MPLASDQLIRPDKNKLADFYHEDELGLFASYKSHMSAAKVVAGTPHHREAWLMLLVAVECLLKDIYCSVRFAAWGNKLPTTDKNKEFYDRSHFTEAGIVKSFGHDLKFLAKHLSTVVSDFRGDSDFEKFTNSLPSDGKWIGLRYRDPHDAAWYKDKYVRLEARLLAILEGKFRRWK
jgi:hypothetical protein